MTKTEKKEIENKSLNILDRIKKGIIRIRFKNLNLQNKILISFVFLIVIPSMLVLYFAYGIYWQLITGKVQTYTYEMVKEINKNIDSNLTTYNKLTMQIYANKEIIENMKKKYKDYSEQFEIENSIKAVLMSLVSYDKNVISTYLIASDGTKYADGTKFVDSDETLRYCEDVAEKADGRIVWLPSVRMKSNYGREYFIFIATREIKATDGTKVGTLILMMKENFFEDIYKSIYFGDNAEKMVISNDLTVVSSENKDIVGKKYTKNDFSDVDFGGGGTLIQPLKGSEYLVVYSTSGITEWTFVSIIPMNELLKEVLKTRNIIVVLAVFLIVFILVTSYLFSKRITLPIKILLEAIRKVENGCFTFSIDDSNNDEVGNLSKSFNSMIKRVHELLVEVREKEITKSQAEIAALQAQINPHFMYNTLNSIKWMAILNKQENIKRMVSALIELLKNTAKNGHELIEVRDEIELLKSYTYIQSVRFTNFKTFYNIPEEMMNFKMMKFILQPIVENSIIHGFGDLDKPGEIFIEFSKWDGNLLITIKDNGIGINEVKDILLEKDDGRYSKMGISNVHRRIISNYGESYGIQIDSIRGEGTSVKVILPIIL